MTRAWWIDRVNVSLAAYPGRSCVEAMEVASQCPPSEPFLGPLKFDHTQICPQNRGIVTNEMATGLLACYPNTRFRLHANARVLPTRYLFDLSDWDRQHVYWTTLASVSRTLGAAAYTAHAGRRHNASLSEILDNARAAEDLFGCRVGVEGHYPTPGDVFLVSSWAEYRSLLELGVGFVVDLSHLHIVATLSGTLDTGLVREMLACDRCLEVRVSGNNGVADQHRYLTEIPWWWGLLEHVHADAGSATSRLSVQRTLDLYKPHVLAPGVFLFCQSTKKFHFCKRLALIRLLGDRKVNLPKESRNEAAVP